MPRSLRLGLAAVLVLTFSIVGCDSADLDPTPSGADATEQSARAVTPAVSLDDPRVAAAMRVQERVTPSFLRRPGVVGTGTRINPGGQPSIVVYVENAARAETADLPEKLDDIAVETRVTGRIDLIDATNPQTRFRPAPNGFSVGHYQITAGTIGARVKDSGGNIYILSNNHVLADVNNGLTGDPILQPGAADGGTVTADQIGTLAAFKPIDTSGAANDIDAALALVNGNDLSGETPAPPVAYGAPSTTIYSGNAPLGLAVQKFGRTTGHTSGQIVAVNVALNVCVVPRGFFSCAEVALFTDQYEIQGGTSTDFSAGGDSGSLIVTDDANKQPVALLFAGGGASTFANPIAAVLDHFNVTIDVPDGSGPTNTAPVASFSYSCTDLACDFDGSGSADSDGDALTYSWSFGDGATASGVTASHTYGADGTYTATLTVNDGSASDSESQSVSVSAGSTGGGVSLSATGYKQRGRHFIDLSWSGATSSQVDVYRNGALITTTANDGAYTDNTGQRGGATYTHQVCEAGTSTCSNTTTTVF